MKLAYICRKFTSLACISLAANTCISIIGADARSSILTRILGTEVAFRFAMPSHKTGFTTAPVIVDELDAIQRPFRKTGIRKTLVHVPFAPRADVTFRATAFESSDLIYARAAVMTSSFVTVVDVYFAELADGSERTRALKIVD